MEVTLFYNNVTILDYAYLDQSYGPLGNSLRVNVEFVGLADSDGIICDFSNAKKKVKDIIDNTIDHRLVILKKHVQVNDDTVLVNLRYGDNKVLEYVCPIEAVLILDDESISINTIQIFLETVISKEMPDNIKKVRISFEEENISKDEYIFQYTHGLKNHNGNCQRLIHGHKNTVKVWVNGIRNRKMEKYLVVDLFKEATHFVYHKNIQNYDEVIGCLEEINGLPLTGRIKNLDFVHIKYQSVQGCFEMKIPGDVVFVLPDETSIENLSKYFNKIIQKKCDKNDQIKIQAFEGIGKGAITIANNAKPTN